MVTVFENGQLLREYSFDEVRERAELPLVKQRKREQQQKQQQNVMIVAVCQSYTTFTCEQINMTFAQQAILTGCSEKSCHSP